VPTSAVSTTTDGLDNIVLSTDSGITIEPQDKSTRRASSCSLVGLCEPKGVKSVVVIKVQVDDSEVQYSNNALSNMIFQNMVCICQ